MFLLGYGIDTNIRQVNTVIYNADGRQESRELLDRLRNSDTFHLIRYVNNDRDLNDAIISGKCRVGVKIPVDYSDRLLHQTGAQVLVLIDGSDSSVAGQAINVTTAIGLDESLRRVLPANRTHFPGGDAAKDSFQSRFTFAEFFLPGLMAVLLVKCDHVSDGVFHRAGERARDAGATLRNARSADGAVAGEIAAIPRDRLFRVVHDADVHAIYISRTDPRQRSVAGVSFTSIPFRVAVAGHPDLQQSDHPGASDATCRF